MSAPLCIRRSTLTALLLGLSLSPSAFASNKLPPVTVRAIVNKTVVGYSRIGAPIDRVTLTEPVTYADLNLTTYLGAMTLKERVREVARTECTKLDDLYPLEDRHPSTCISRAVADASHQIDQAIARAERDASAH